MKLLPEFAFQALLKNFTKKSIDETQLERARWRWEFLRLNGDYINDCSNLKEEISEQLPTHNNYGLTCWIKPEFTFDEYLKNIADQISDSDYDNIDKADDLRYLAISILGGPFENAVRLLRDSYVYVEVGINLLLPDNEILEEVSELLRERRDKILKRRPSKALENYLKAVSLKKAGKTPIPYRAI